MRKRADVFRDKNIEKSVANGMLKSYFRYTR